MSDVMEYDILVVGAGLAGLSAAITLKQNAPDLRVCVLEKASYIGGHLISGAIFDPKALNELIPDWREKNFPVSTEVQTDSIYYLSTQKATRLPHALLPKTLSNRNCFIISIAALAQALAKEAEQLGVEIYAGFSGSTLLFNEAKDTLIGIETAPMGLDKAGNPKENHMPGLPIHARYTVFAEGARGFLSEQVIQHFGLKNKTCERSYGLGFKEVWKISETRHQKGRVEHYIGWPLGKKAYGGGYLYHAEDNCVNVGLVLGLDYQNAALDPFTEFQQMKTHPHITNILEGGERIGYGARVLNEGGLMALPRLSFPGGLLVGDSAGFLNVARLKGNHAAMKSGMLAARGIEDALKSNMEEPEAYTKHFKDSWLYQELHQTRNWRAWFKKGFWTGVLASTVEQKILRGRMPWSLSWKQPDRDSLKPFQKDILYPKPDGILTFDRASSVFLANLQHDENQPCHLHIKDKETFIQKSFTQFHAPETRYCPAGVYERVRTPDGDSLQINAQNCIHCKTCDLKDPTHSITWRLPEGGSGPQYRKM